MDFFWVKHPDIEKPARVPETALDYWVGRGWAPVDDPEAEPPSQLEEPAELAEPATTRARRRPATEE